MEDLEIRQSLTRIIHETLGTDGEYADDHTLTEDIGLDSLSFIGLIVEIEVQFTITMPDDLLVQNTLQTFEDLVRVVKELVQSSTGERRTSS